MSDLGTIMQETKEKAEILKRIEVLEARNKKLVEKVDHLGRRIEKLNKKIQKLQPKPDEEGKK